MKGTVAVGEFVGLKHSDFGRTHEAWVTMNIALPGQIRKTLIVHGVLKVPSAEHIEDVLRCVMFKGFEGFKAARGPNGLNAFLRGSQLCHTLNVMSSVIPAGYKRGWTAPTTYDVELSP